MSLDAGGDILNASSSAAIRGASNVTLTAGGSIGTETSAIRLTGGTGEMKVSAEAGGSIHLDATLSTAKSLTGSLVAQDDVSVVTTKDLKLGHLVGTDVSLQSNEGDIDVQDFVQNAALDATERFDATAANGSIDVRVSEGDLGVGEVVASGNVRLTVEKGNLKDALPRENESALTVEERLDAWKAAGLIGDSGENIGLATWESDVEKAEAGVRNDFALYKAYCDAGGEEVLTSDKEKSFFAELQARFANYADAEAAVAGERADSSTALGKLAALQENYGWTQNDLLYAVAEAIANPDSGYVPTAGTPNIRGARIVLNAAGSIGLNADAVTGKVDSTTAEGLEILKYLAQADVDDVTWHEDGSVTVSLKHAVTVEGDAFAGDAGENLYVQSTDDSSLNVERAVAANGAVRLTSRQGIVGLEDKLSGNFGFVSGSTVTTRGGEGGVGAAGAPMHVSHGEDGWLALSSDGDIHVDADGESLTIYSIAGGGDVHLKASDLYAYKGDAFDFEDESIRFDNLGYMSAGEGGVFHLEVTGNLGQEDAALRFDSDAKLSFAESVKNVWIETIGDEGVLEINDIQASGVVDVNATAGLTVGNVAGDSVTLAAVGNLSLLGTEVVVDELFSATAGETLLAAGVNLTVGSRPDGAPGDVIFRSETGDIDLSDAVFTGTSGSLGEVTIEAGADAQLDGLFADEKDFTATQLTVAAGEALGLGDEALGVTVTQGDLVLEATTLREEGFGDGSVFHAAGDVTMSFASDLHAGEGFTAMGENVVFRANDYSVGDGSTVRADSLVTIEAQGDVALTGDVLVTGNEAVSVSAETGGIGLFGAVTIGDETENEASADVMLTAHGDIVQTVTSGDGGVRADALTATSDTGAVQLGAGRDETVGSAGNAFSSAEVEAVGDVILGTAGRETTVTINESRDGVVEGDLKLYGYANSWSIQNDVTVKGDALIHGSAIHGGSLIADGSLEMVAALFDESIKESDLSGVHFDGTFSADQVSVFTQKGDIEIGFVEATDGYVDIYRLSQSDKGEVNIGGGSATSTITVSNANGDVNLTGDLVGGNTVYAFTGNGGKTNGAHHLVSLIHKAAAIDDAEKLSEQIDLTKFLNFDATQLAAGQLPHLSFTARQLEYADTDLASPIVHSAIETISPTDEFFFLHLRADAAESDGIENKDEEQAALEEGLPTRKDHLIVDHRKKGSQGDEEIRMILSMR